MNIKIVAKDNDILWTYIEVQINPLEYHVYSKETYAHLIKDQFQGQYNVVVTVDIIELGYEYGFNGKYVPHIYCGYLNFKNEEDFNRFVLEHS